jgi:predicted dehydrogenase
MKNFSRRSFIHTGILAGVAIGCSPGRKFQDYPGEPKSGIQGFEVAKQKDLYAGWVPVSDRKVRVGLIGYGLCRFGAEFGFQNHINVDVVAVSDLIPQRCASMAEETGCKKTYPSLEELVKDTAIEAVFIATDAPNHFKHAMLALKHGKHVASAVPAVFGSLEDAERLFNEVKQSGLNYMMFETSSFHEDLYAMRLLYSQGLLGKIIYSEGEYYHYMAKPLESYKGWRIGLPPQYYPTHATAYYVGVTDGSFAEVSCMGIPSKVPHLMAANNEYKNPFGTESAHFRTNEGGMSRMIISWDTPGDHGEKGRIRSEKGTYYDKYEGLPINMPVTLRPPLPPGLPAGYHGGSHGNLTNEFILSILQNRKPMIDVAVSLNMTVPGIVAHQSALNDGELMKIPQYKYWS